MCCSLILPILTLHPSRLTSITVYMLKSKNEVFKTFKKWKVKVETQMKVKWLRSYNDGKYKNEALNKFYKNEGIVRHFILIEISQRNEIVERMNSNLLEKWCMLSNANLGKKFWAKSINTSCFIVNRSPSTITDCKTSQDVWLIKPTNYFDMRMFGC